MELLYSLIAGLLAGTALFVYGYRRTLRPRKRLDE